METWDDILCTDFANLNHVHEKIKTLQMFIKDYNDGNFYVQQVDDIAVIPMNIENLWVDVLHVVEGAINYQECLETAYCLM